MSSLILSNIEKTEGKRVLKYLGVSLDDNDLCVKRPKSSWYPDYIDNNGEPQPPCKCFPNKCGTIRPNTLARLKAVAKAPRHMTPLGFMKEMTAKADAKTLMVFNLPPEINDESLFLEIFKSFGEVTSSHLAPLDIHGTRRGRLGFVTFVNKEDAQQAINTLDGFGPYGIDQLNLEVDWALNSNQSSVS